MRVCVCVCACTCVYMHSFFVSTWMTGERSQLDILYWSKVLSLVILHIGFTIEDKKSLKQWILGQVCFNWPCALLHLDTYITHRQTDRENMLFEFCSSFAFTFITVNHYFCPLLYSLEVFLTCRCKLNVSMICKFKNRVRRMFM